MDSLSSWLGVCSILTFVAEFNTYVLFAANVDDFRNIARKIVPETLADKLARLASVPAKQKSRVDITESEYEYGSETEDFENDFENERDDENITEKEESNIRNVNSMYVKDWNTRVNFEELVERVKDRLAKEMRDEIQKRIEKTQKIKHENTYSKKEIQNIPEKIIIANKETFGYNINRDYETENTENYKLNNKYHINKRFTEVTRNYEPITSYHDDKYEGSEKVYPDKPIKPEYFDYKENKQSYNDGGEKYKTDRLKDNYSPDINVQDNIKDKQYIEKYVYENYDVNKHHDIEKEDYKTEDLYDKYHKKDSEKYLEKENENSKERNKTIKIHKHFKETTPEASKIQNNEFLYNKFDLISKRKNDSYEEYEVPNKEENVYASEEVQDEHSTDKSNYNVHKNSRFQIKNNPKENVRPFKSEWKADRYKGKDDTKESEEIKAKTESLWFEDRSKDTEIISEVKSKGTMIPTRETYKMSSPNYYISLPTIAERYDSDEPLPERDRERQILKHFVNPPASINKKVRLLK